MTDEQKAKIAEAFGPHFVGCVVTPTGIDSGADVDNQTGEMIAIMCGALVAGSMKLGRGMAQLLARGNTAAYAAMIEIEQASLELHLTDDSSEVTTGRLVDRPTNDPPRS